MLRSRHGRLQRPVDRRHPRKEATMTTQGTRVKLTGPRGSDPGRPDERRGGGAEAQSPSLEGYLAEPRGAGPRRAGGVVVIQEWFGINDHMKWMVERIAQAGFVALAPDLF